MREPVIRPELEHYAEVHTTPGPDWLAAIARTTLADMPEKQSMLTGHLEGQFLAMLTWLVHARRALEIGTFTGYSALSMIRGMPNDGQVITCEIDPEHAAIARRNIEASPYAGRIEVREGPALDTVNALDGPFDFIFIDADKRNLTAYYEAVLPKLADRGLIAVDNTLWYSQVIDDTVQDHDTVAVRAFNDHVVADGRVECVQLTVRDGVTLIRKR
jgi:caffeoyl-CoA O-methyltransferase